MDSLRDALNTLKNYISGIAITSREGLVRRHDQRAGIAWRQLRFIRPHA